MTSGQNSLHKYQQKEILFPECFLYFIQSLSWFYIALKKKMCPNFIYTITDTFNSFIFKESLLLLKARKSQVNINFNSLNIIQK